MKTAKEKHWELFCENSELSWRLADAKKAGDVTRIMHLRKREQELPEELYAYKVAANQEEINALDDEYNGLLCELEQARTAVERIDLEIAPECIALRASLQNLNRQADILRYAPEAVQAKMRAVTAKIKALKAEIE